MEGLSREKQIKLQELLDKIHPPSQEELVEREKIAIKNLRREAKGLPLIPHTELRNIKIGRTEGKPDVPKMEEYDLDSHDRHYDNFNRPEFWEKSRLFNEIMKQERTPEQNEKRFPKSYPLGRSMFAGPLGGGFDDDEKWHRYAQTAEAPWDEPLLMDRYMVKPSGKTGKMFQYKEPSRESPIVAFGKLMHSNMDNLNSPRAQVVQAAKNAGLSYREQAARDLFVEKYGRDAWNEIKDPSEDPRVDTNPGLRLRGGYASLGQGRAYVPQINKNYAPQPYDVTAMHEQEHLVGQEKFPRYTKSSGDVVGDAMNDAKRATTEIGPTMGDIVNTAATYRAKYGKPLDMDVRFPAGTVQNPDTMAQWAYEHGYNQKGGPSMSELIFGTPEGRKWLKYHAGERPMAKKWAGRFGRQ